MKKGTYDRTFLIACSFDLEENNEKRSVKKEVSVIEKSHCKV